MEYLYLFIACAFFALQFVFQKLFERRTASGMQVCLWNQLFCCAAATVFLACSSGLPTKLTAGAALYIILYSLASFACAVCTIMAMSLGSVGLISSFCLVGGMVVPFFYGIFFLSETASLMKWLGILVLCISVLVPMFKRGNAETQRGGGRFFLLCAVIFLSNGFVSVFSKMHQISPDAIAESDFVLLCSVFRMLLVFVMLLVMALRRAGKGEKRAMRQTFYEIGRSPMTGKLFAFLIAVSAMYAVANTLGNLFSLKCMVSMDASIQFPILSAVVIVLSALFGRIFFGERFTKATVLSLALSMLGIVLFML